MLVMQNVKQHSQTALVGMERAPLDSVWTLKEGRYFEMSGSHFPMHMHFALIATVAQFEVWGSAM